MRALVLSISLTVGCAQAFAQFSDVLNRLTSGDVESVEQSYSILQDKFEKGVVTEYNLLDAYKVFYQREDRYIPQLNRWIKAYPNSASAYLARGVYYRKLGESRRGTEYISQVPPDNLRYMEQMHDAARKDLETALRLNPKSYLAILHLLNIAQFEGDDRAATDYLELGNAILPSNFILRARYLIQLAPRWGGSYESMEAFIEKCQSQGVSQDRIDLLNAIKFNDQGMVAEEEGRIDQARSAYQKALRLSISGGRRFRREYLAGSTRMCAEPEHRAKQYCQ